MDFDLQSCRSFNKAVVYLISYLVVAALSTFLIDHNPLIVEQVPRLLDRKLSQGSFVAVDNLIVGEDLRRSKHMALDANWCLINAQFPVFN